LLALTGKTARELTVTRTRLQGAVTGVTGLSDYEFLSGNIGTQRLEVTADAYPSCATCAGQTYVPLGYFEYGLRGAVELEVTERLMLGASASSSWRTYDGEAFITSVPESAKRREDRRLGLGAVLEIALDQEGSVVLALSYDVLFSESNVALDPADAEHALDYHDRSYVQHIVQTGLEFHF
jgi:hypothetical protein